MPAYILGDAAIEERFLAALGMTAGGKETARERMTAKGKETAGERMGKD